jgi:hypothetical protein
MKAHFADFLRRWRAMDPIVRAMIQSWITGMAVGLVCAALLLLIDFAGLRTLLWKSDMRAVGALLLSAGFAFSFGGLVAAGAAMNGFGAGEDDEPGRGRGWQALTFLQKRV